jgi:hypothetical protein
MSKSFALCADAVVDGLLLTPLLVPLPVPLLTPLLVLLPVLLLLVPPLFQPDRPGGGPNGRPNGPVVHAVLSVGEPAEAAPLPLRSAEIDCRSCSNALVRSLMLLVPELAVAAVLLVTVVLAASVLLVTVVLAASALPVSARPPPSSEISDPRSVNKLDSRLPAPAAPSVEPGGGKVSGPPGAPTPSDPAPAEVPLVPSALLPKTPPNDRNWDIRPVDSVGNVLPVTALPDAPSADDPAEAVVAVVAADPLLWLDWAADCAARSAASCAQRSLCPDIELSIGSLTCDDVRTMMCGSRRKRASRQAARLPTNAADRLGDRCGLRGLNRRFLPGWPVPPGKLCRMARLPRQRGQPVRSARAVMRTAAAEPHRRSA